MKISYRKKMNYKQKEIQELSQDLKSKGFRVWLAENGEYGFYSDKSAGHIVSFQINLGVISYSGNYKSRSHSGCGSGWILSSGLSYAAMLKDTPPFWAIRDNLVKFCTVQDHLEQYGKSSRFEEVTFEEKEKENENITRN